LCAYGFFLGESECGPKEESEKVTKIQQPAEKKGIHRELAAAVAACKSKEKSGWRRSVVEENEGKKARRRSRSWRKGAQGVRESSHYCERAPTLRREPERKSKRHLRYFVAHCGRKTYKQNLGSTKKSEKQKMLCPIK